VLAIDGRFGRRCGRRRANALCLDVLLCLVIAVIQQQQQQQARSG